MFFLRQTIGLSSYFQAAKLSQSQSEEIQAISKQNPAFQQLWDTLSAKQRQA